VGGGEGDEDIFAFAPGGPLVLPGKYQASLAIKTQGTVKPLVGPVEFAVKYVGAEGLPDEGQKQLVEFQQQVIALQRELTAVQGLATEVTTKLDAIKAALDQTPAASAESRETVRKLIAEQRKTVRLLNGDNILRGRNENTPVSISERVGYAAGATRTIINKPTATEREQYAIAKKELEPVGVEVRNRLLKDIKALEGYLDQIGAPWTPGRVR